MYLLPYRETPRHLESKVQLLQCCHLRSATVCHGETAFSVYRCDTGWTVRRSNPGGSEIFYTRPDRPWGPLNLLNIGCRVFPEGKAAGAWRWPPTPSSAEVKLRVEIYLYSPSGPSWPVLGSTLPYLYSTSRFDSVCHLLFDTVCHVLFDTDSHLLAE
jgi:hypothetical protein